MAMSPILRASCFLFSTNDCNSSEPDDVSFRLAPLKELGALHMIESTKAGKLLLGVRGEKPSDIQSIVGCLERMSQLLIDFPEIQEIDINPLLVFEQGKGSKAVEIGVEIRLIRKHHKKNGIKTSIINNVCFEKNYELLIY
jgi:hypothetical protein